MHLAERIPRSGGGENWNSLRVLSFENISTVGFSQYVHFPYEVILALAMTAQKHRLLLLV
jgi:hypothetical protein